ncbi:MAG: aerotaxis receptor Aer [Hydrogenophilales bacterium CG03_land_8_20_14_0_80_62_28]|nr:PAS domain-containing protein [Betaproteobacteria bacterium]OIO79304.1 MAG: aerotaxis receptor Aer [Hydrogenophilaceae bacterium CG1_02_62_390]PIV24552.1 MAG: aerotaxis receptor Aer [Hydrogenophilales bacterium CG03_land_8_20_14_0_80_62_28]PIW39024.1 MAG: aerotaxis receptor Aer [Hydrogenophilales bacterium CG15_BIG_FIL_POST_REV_8_21_14_020_62_31]PIW70773.1 MAG: aerotaxis receptor Aer [Hydrogenophilales bacterium CG12_big_fil_rev_8_21_14_0_65_61_21]PIY99550.1 MAG: aerotaxis receptor Aer [Hyd
MSKSSKAIPNRRERVLPDDAFITSKTDTRGKILYGNPIFIDLSGYSEDELLGAPHNIIRHPDMPRGVFKALWDTISAGKEFLGYVKNMSADGGFYWVYATVTPDFDAAGRITGYYSVRRKPRREAINLIEPIYRAMLAAETRASGSQAPAEGLAVLQRLIQESGKNDYTAFVLDL